ncbi:hypothetical protein AG1IA_04924 [Rhizoctonia solani AG-1 IA]|uniref:Uncharacterized protein n=1 Tax=Thanatephorus cucumeris (strain AG1-IA) TaxID=983506 RepID=L8WSC7_THACA|nr:hypothetical protein AG1IA_04924 [Rhizoctonia solani AG-1 IA]
MEPSSNRYRRGIQRGRLPRRSTGLGTTRRPGVAHGALVGMDVFRRRGWKCSGDRNVDVGAFMRGILPGRLLFLVRANMPSNLDKYLPGVPQATINKLYGSIKSARNASPAIRQGVIQDTKCRGRKRFGRGSCGKANADGTES